MIWNGLYSEQWELSEAFRPMLDPSGRTWEFPASAMGSAQLFTAEVSPSFPPQLTINAMALAVSQNWVGLGSIMFRPGAASFLVRA